MFKNLFAKLFKKKKSEKVIPITRWKFMEIMREWCEESQLSLQHVMFKGDNKEGVLRVYTDRPGYLIGKAGRIIYKYEKQLKELCPKYKIELYEVDRVWSVEEEKVYLDSILMEF